VIVPTSSSPSKESAPQVPQSFIKDYGKRKEIFQEALKLFRHKQHEQAGARFEWLGEIKYRPAYSYYMAGECAYEQKHYTQAISFYKHSALIKDKTTYMPILLWHTAWSFGFLKDQANFERFMRSLSQLYPQSEQGKKATEILQKRQKTESKH
ncbi:tetratricopeptide repeat protein, partial [Helicobacter mehlei]